MDGVVLINTGRVSVQEGQSIVMHSPIDYILNQGTPLLLDCVLCLFVCLFVCHSLSVNALTYSSHLSFFESLHLNLSFHINVYMYILYSSRYFPREA